MEYPVFNLIIEKYQFSLIAAIILLYNVFYTNIIVNSLFNISHIIYTGIYLLIGLLSDYITEVTVFLVGCLIVWGSRIMSTRISASFTAWILTLTNLKSLIIVINIIGLYIICNKMVFDLEIKWSIKF